MYPDNIAVNVLGQNSIDNGFCGNLIEANESTIILQSKTSIV